MQRQKNVAKKRFLVSNTMAMYVRARIGTYAVLCKTTTWNNQVLRILENANAWN